MDAGGDSGQNRKPLAAQVDAGTPGHSDYIKQGHFHGAPNNNEHKNMSMCKDFAVYRKKYPDIQPKTLKRHSIVLSEVANPSLLYAAITPNR